MILKSLRSLSLLPLAGCCAISLVAAILLSSQVTTHFEVQSVLAKGVIALGIYLLLLSVLPLLFTPLTRRKENARSLIATTLSRIFGVFAVAVGSFGLYLASVYAYENWWPAVLTLGKSEQQSVGRLCGVTIVVVAVMVVSGLILNIGVRRVLGRAAITTDSAHRP